MNHQTSPRINLGTLIPLLMGATLSVIPTAHSAYQQTNLVSDIPGLAVNTDPNLVNPWGIAESSGSPFWISDEGNGKSTLYNTTGTPQALVVTIPGGPPTGIAFNSKGAAAYQGYTFLFAQVNGSLAGWKSGTTATVIAAQAGSSYTGLALGSTATDNLLYAANFASGYVDVFRDSTNLIAPSKSFTDASLPVGYHAFNVYNFNNTLYVSYALFGTDGHDQAGAGHGYIDTYDLNGNLLGRFASGGALDSPWGMAVAPSTFGDFAGDLLVGNFGDGTINAFNLTSGAFQGTLTDASGNPIVNSGLWGLQFGNGGNGGSLNTLYFTAGIDNETHGLFGAITASAATNAPVPEPATTSALGAAALLGLCAVARARRKISNGPN